MQTAIFQKKIFLEKDVELLLSSKIKTIGEYSLIGFLGRIQDLTKGGSDKRPPKAVVPRECGGMLPLKIFNFRASEMRFPAFSGVI